MNYLNNYVRPSTSTGNSIRLQVSGLQLQKEYLEIVGSNSSNSSEETVIVRKETIIKSKTIDFSEKDLFKAAENDDISFMKLAVAQRPECINAEDEFGWSLLMIACQARSVKIVKYLSQKGADILKQDKAGNSCYSLLANQRNYGLLKILLQNSPQQINKTEQRHSSNCHEFYCNNCKSTYPDKSSHLSSTVHNMTINKIGGEKSWYTIPETNRGFQMLLKSGWDRNKGLGPDGIGRRYPIKAIKKEDRKCLGNKEEKKNIIMNTKSNYKYQKEKDSRRERNFRRLFY